MRRKKGEKEEKEEKGEKEEKEEKEKEEDVSKPVMILEIDKRSSWIYFEI